MSDKVIKRAIAFPRRRLMPLKRRFARAVEDNKNGVVRHHYLLRGNIHKIRNLQNRSRTASIWIQRAKDYLQGGETPEIVPQSILERFMARIRGVFATSHRSVQEYMIMLPVIRFLQYQEGQLDA